jgi:di/tricarboxylate transporter
MMPEKFPDNKFFRRLALVWVMMLITVIVLLTWLRTPNISAGTAAALGSVVGILTAVIGFYQWSRQQDDKKEQDHVDTD